MVPGPSYKPKDFTLLKRDGLYHLFYIRRNVMLPYAQTERDLGHAVSPDLWIWNQLPPVIPARDSSWDSDHIWAPTIVLKDSIYWMFYTGVADSPGTYSLYQRTGVATSTDLLSWNRYDTPVWGCADVPWSWCDSTTASTGFRDPFVMPDPLTPGHWLMYTSTYPASDSGGMVVDVAASDGDLTQWTDLGPLWITHRSYTYNTVVESPHLFEHAGLWYLFYTTNAGQPITFSTGSDPVGEPSTWTYRGRLGTLLGLDTNAWYASEHLLDGLVDYFAFVVADRVEIYRMEWGADWRFSLVQPDFLHVRSMAWSADTVRERDPVTLTIVAANWQGRSISLEAVGGANGQPDSVLSLDRLGLPATLALTADTVRIAWPAVSLADTSDPARAFRVTLRLTDRTAATLPLVIVAAPPGPPPEDPPDDHVEDRVRGGGILIGPINTARPLRAQRGLLLEMRSEARVRLDLYDLQGRRVRGLVDRRLPVGATVVTWDGRDATGAAALPGVYFARIVTPGESRTVRLVLTRQP